MSYCGCFVRIIDLAGLENGNMRSYEDMKLHLVLWCFMEWDNCAVKVPLEDQVLGFTIRFDLLTRRWVYPVEYYYHLE